MSWSMSRLGSCLIAAFALCVASGAVAQQNDSNTPGYSSLGVSTPNGTRELQQALSRLAANSRDLDALIDAGNAALVLGDPQAAIGFFARADGLDQRNPRVKAGLASALLGNENPYEALRLFEEAKAFGAPDSLIAADRGLAYDLVGNNAAAQQDYAIALRRGGDDEIVRRYALSLAISGNRKAAEAQLDPLLRQGDTAAWRTRAFVLAIDGDDDGAIAIARSTMQLPVAQAMEPFLEYMDKLTPAQQAAAAHFGHFPQSAAIGREDPRNRQYAGVGRVIGGSGADAGLIPLGEPLGSGDTARSSRRAAKVDKSTRRRPGRAAASEASPPPETPSRTRRASGRAAVAAQTVDAPAATPPASPAATPAPAPVQIAKAPPPPPEPMPEPRAQPAAVVSSAQQTVVSATDAVATLEGVRPGFQSFETSQGARAVMSSNAAVASNPSASNPSGSGSFDLAALDRTAPASSVQPQASTEKAADLGALMAAIEVPASELKRDEDAVDLSKITPAKPAPPKPKPVASPPPPKHPSRHWVQIAGGANSTTLAREYKRIAAIAPDAFKGKKGYWTPLNQTNRILTGPFESSNEAQNFVNLLAKSDIAAFTFTSDEGQEITGF